jgi:cell division protein FtsB
MSFSRKRTKPRQKLSPIQEKRFLRISVALVAIALLWVLLAPGSGLLSLWKKHQELQRLQQQTVQLEKENEALRKDIERLQNDPGYLEEIARKDYGLLKKNERVFEFAPRKSAKEKE